MTLSVGVVSFMFFFAYLPQLAVLFFMNGPLAAITTVLLTLSESSTIISLLSRTFLIQDALVDTFDGVLVARNQSALLSEGRQLKAGNFQDPIAKLGKLIKSPFEKFTPKALIRYILYLPLNFIPVVGTVAFVLLQGRSRGNSVHTRLKNWSNSQREAWLKKNTAPYTAFGVVATFLELVPVASILFSFTNTVGAALWASDIESSNTAMTQMTTSDSTNAAKKGE
ncbi:hypothetical protein B7494_g5505 [Chlorociboria aeruginascens]|nr:hypothetical protein B7494_g5505 [Chlorociboria aeruginascens]